MAYPSIIADGKRHPKQDSFAQVRILLIICLSGFFGLGLLAAPLPVPAGKPTNYPSWWFSRGVIMQSVPTNAAPAYPTNYPVADDYAVVTEGQVKNIATQAFSELQANAPAYVWSTAQGASLASMVGKWTSPATNEDDYQTMNLGQLKTAVAPFYNVLGQINYITNYPWSGTNADDYTMANIGQTKNAFSFDVGYSSSSDGIPDWWERKYLGETGVNATNLASNGSGLTILQSYEQGINPTQSVPTPSGNDSVGGPCAPAGTFGSNPNVPLVGLNPYTGNATRVVNDLSVASISEVGLNFTRYANSRLFAAGGWLADGPLGNQLQLFGAGMPWRHSFQWDVYLTSTGTFLITYPNGTSNTFTQTGTSGSLKQYTSSFPVTDVVTADASGNVYLTTTGHIVYKFASAQNVQYSVTATVVYWTRYVLVSITDSKGLITTVTNSSQWYGNSNILLPTKITEPGGRYITIYYKFITPHYEAPYVEAVTSSDGRSVNFGYAELDPVDSSAFEHMVLENVSYSGVASAAYAYYNNSSSSTGYLYSLSQAVDSRAVGIPNIVYGYAGSVTGAVKTISEGSSNTLICTLSLQNANAQTPVVLFPDGSYFEYNYLAGGLLATVTNSQGRSQSYAYTGSGTGTWTITSTDANGNVTVSSENSNGYPLTVIMPQVDGETTGPKKTYSYNAAGYLTSFTDNLGRITTLARDPASNVVTQVSYADATTESYTYNSFNEILTHTQRNGGIEHFTYDSTGLLLTRQDATQSASQVTTFAYDSNYRLGSVTDANGHATSYLYNDAGQITTIKNPDNTTHTFTYGAKMVISEQNELGNTTSYAYDGFNRILTATDPLNRVTTYAYGTTTPTNPHPLSVTLPSGEVKSATYAPAWGYEEISLTDGYGTADSATTVYGYDSVGNVIGVTDPRGNTTIVDYDARNRKVAAQDPAGNDSFFYYDDDDNLTASTTPDGTTLNVYDVMGRLTQSTDPKGGVVYMSFDSGGSLSTYKDSNGRVYNYSYDLNERQLSMQYPDLSSETYVYDPVGNLATYTTRDGKIKSLTYDNRNRSTAYSWNDGVTPSASIVYDNGSRITSITNSNSAISFTYDNDGETLTEAQNVTGLGSKAVTYAYNADGTVNTLTYPDSTALTYTYNSRGQITGIKQGSATVANYTYDAAGNPITKSLANGVSTALTYDAVERITSITDLAGSTQLQSFNYGYDSMSRRKYVKRNGGLGDVYTYDSCGQLISVQYNATNPDINPSNPQQTTTFSFDSAGNRTQVVDSIHGTTTYVTNPENQYSSVNGAELSYDAKGNLSANNGWSYTYNAENRLIQAQNGASTVTFAYDPDGRCVKRVDGGTTSYFIYQSGWSLLADYSSTGSLVNRYVIGSGANEILTKTDGSNNVVYYHYDGLGSVTELSGATGALLEQYSYDVYGNGTIKNASGTVISASAYSNRFMFAGSEYIASADLYQNRERVYSARLGRFLQTDPLGHDGDAYNIYRYCGNDPINDVDPFGCDGRTPDDGLDDVGYDYVGVQADVTNAPSYDSTGGITSLNGTIVVTAITQAPGSGYGASGGAPGTVSGGFGAGGGASLSGGTGGGGGGSSGSNFVNSVQTALNVAGLFPVVGEVANGANAIISLAQGHYVDAGASVFAMIPIVGAIGDIARLGKAAEEAGPIWSATKNLTAEENAAAHAAKHAGEFPELASEAEYTQAAQNFVKSPPSGALTKVRPNGDTLIYDPATNTFAVRAANGAPRTMFRPTDGANYWNKQ